MVVTRGSNVIVDVWDSTDKQGYERSDKQGYERSDEQGYERSDEQGYERSDKQGYERSDDEGLCKNILTNQSNALVPQKLVSSYPGTE